MSEREGFLLLEHLVRYSAGECLLYKAHLYIIIKSDVY